MIDLEKEIEEMGMAVDEFATKEVTPGTPLHTFQQSMIQIMKKYREDKATDDMWKNPANCRTYIPGSKL